MRSGDDFEYASAALGEKRAQITSLLMEKIPDDHIYQMKFGADWITLLHEDIELNLDNLILAVRFNLKDSPANHFRYMQSLLVNRGRCTLLIREAISALSDTVQILIPEHWETIRLFLESAVEGIAYSDPGSIALMSFQTIIAQGAAENLGRRFPESADDENWVKLRRRELELFISYLEDGLEKKAPKYFADFTSWVAAYHSKASIDPEVIDQELNSLSKEITHYLEPKNARRLRPIIAKVRRSI
jgi:hypothetical protein